MNNPFPLRAVLLTTRDRPELLAQALPQIEAQAASLGLRLYVADDGSVDPEAIRLVLQARGRGAVLLLHQPSDPPDPVNALPVFSTGRRFVTAVRRLIADLGNEAAFIKVDDDVFLAPDCFERLAHFWSALAGRAPTLSALLDSKTNILCNSSIGAEVSFTEWSSSVCCVHRLDLWALALAELGDDHFVNHGWDVGFFWHWLNRRRHGIPHTLSRSLAYHAGHVGTRTTIDLNRQPPDPAAFPGSWAPEGVVTSAITRPQYCDGRTQ